MTDKVIYRGGIKYVYGSGGIRTHAPEETGALNQRLRPLGHATLLTVWVQIGIIKKKNHQNQNKLIWYIVLGVEFFFSNMFEFLNSFYFHSPVLNLSRPDKKSVLAPLG